jgi:Histidine kinase
VKKLFIHSPFFRLLAPLVFGVMVYMLILLVGNNLNDISQIFSNQELYVSIALTYLSFECLRLMIVITKKINFRSTQNEITIATIAGLFVSLLVISGSMMAYFKLAVGFDISLGELTIFWVIFGLTALLYNTLYFSNEFLFKENTLLLEQESRLKEKIEHDFLSFKNELNPDLLYESLETLLSSLHHRTDEAEEQIDLLADVYRYQLVHRKKELVPLSDEFKALNSLSQLLNHRYQKQIKIINEALDFGEHHAVPGSLLVAFDAVVRNTLVSKDAPLEVKLYPEGEDYLVMQHKIFDKLALHQESLQNFARLQRSYSFFSDQPFVQVKADRENYIKFPLIKILEEQPTA